MKVLVINNSSNLLPDYSTPDSSGVDLRAELYNGVNEKFLFDAEFNEDTKVLTIFPGGRALIPTGIFTAIPSGHEAQIRSRSGLALKNGIIVLNQPGTIDADYRNEWGIILANFGNSAFEVKSGDRIAQAVFVKVEKITWDEVDILDDTVRNLGGFGHTGVA